MGNWFPDYNQSVAEHGFTNIHVPERLPQKVFGNYETTNLITKTSPSDVALAAKASVDNSNLMGDEQLAEIVELFKKEGKSGYAIANYSNGTRQE